MPTAEVTRVTATITKGEPPPMKLTVLSLVLVALTSSILAQTPYIETFEVRLHNLDVVVTDAKGKPVRGLTKDDFVVTENGAPQQITNFSIYDTLAATASSVPAAADSSADANVAVQSAPSAPPPRRIVFFIDDLSVQKMARNRLYANVKSFVDAMRPGDVAAVVRPTSQGKIVQEFTGDHAAIEAALKQAIDESSVKSLGTKAEVAALRWQLKIAGSPLARRQAKREYADAAARRVEHRLGQVRALTSSLGGVEGKKIVVLVTMGLSAKPGSEAWDFAETLGAIRQPQLNFNFGVNVDRPEVPEEIPPADDPERTYAPVVHDLTRIINEIAQSAAANGVTIYALEPDVPLDLLVRGNASIPGKLNGDHVGADPAMELPSSFQTDILQNAEVTLASLTETTGGRWFRGISSIDDTFRQVSEDVSFYYSLAYRANGDADKARRVKVSVRNRPELKVRTRTDVLAKSTGREMSDLVVASLLYPREVNELGIKVTPGTPAKERGWYTIPFDVVIPLRNLTFLLDEAGEKYVASFDLHYAATGEERDFGNGGKHHQTIEISPEQYANVANTTYRYKTGIQVSPGRARIAIGVLDTATRLTGFETVEVLAQ
jgi:VWFA-related protein